MDNTVSPMHSSASCQERWARPRIPTYRAVLRKGKEFHNVYLHGLFVAYYDRFHSSLGESANPEDDESIRAWRNRALGSLARLMLHVSKQINPTEFRALQHSPVDTPATKPHPPLVSSIEPTVNRNTVTGATEPTSSSSKFPHPPKPESRRYTCSPSAAPPVDGSGDTAILGAGPPFRSPITMNNAPLDCSLAIQERWARPFIPTYRAVSRKGKEFHDVYLHGLFVAYYDRFSTSFGELANPADIESIHAWKNRGMENLARLMLHVYKQTYPTEFRALQHSPMDTPSDGPGDTEISGAGEPTSGNAFAGPPKLTSIRKSERIASKRRLNPNPREAPPTKRRRQNTSSELTL